MRDESEGTVTVCKRLVCVCVSAYASVCVCTHDLCVCVSAFVSVHVYVCVVCYMVYMYPLDESTEATQREH